MKRIPLRANRDDASSVIGYVELKDVHEQTLAEHMATFGRMGVTGIVHVNGLSKGVECLCIAPTESVPLWNNQIRVEVPDRTPEVGNRFNASVEGKPQPGQWWVLNESERRIHTDPKSQVVFFCGKDAKGRMIFEDPDGNVEVDQDLDWRNWYHEPACTGWDWVPETFPQWYSYKTGPFESLNDCYLIRRESMNEASFVHRSGKVEKVQYPWRSDEYTDNLKSGHWKKLSQQEADEALRPKKFLSPDVVNDLAVSLRKETSTSVTESPDDWVTQDLVRVRVGVDEFRYTNPGWTDPWEWRLAQENDNWTPEALHGFTDEDGDRLELRCRRKDFPGVDEKANVVKSLAEDPGDGYRFLSSDEVVLETDERAYVYEDSEAIGLSWGEVDKAVWFESGKTAGDLRRKLRAKNVVFRRKATDPAKVATVTVYEVFYGDEVGENGDELTLAFCTSEKDINRLREVWKYVSVVSTKTVEVML